MEISALALLLEQAREKIKEAQGASDKQFPGLDNYIEKALQNVDMALLNLGVAVPETDSKA
jgi:hypothetical protein